MKRFHWVMVDHLAGTPGGRSRSWAAKLSLKQHSPLLLTRVRCCKGGTTECIDYLRIRCARLANEVFGVLWLDTRHRFIDAEHLFTGTNDGCEIHPRIVAKLAMETNAATMVLFHNHPLSNPESSEADRRSTARLKQALAMLDVRVLDNIILGGAQAVSLAASGGHCLGSSHRVRLKNASLDKHIALAGLAGRWPGGFPDRYLEPVLGDVLDAAVVLVQS